MEKELVHIQYLDASVRRLEYVADKSDWIDLASAFEVHLEKGAFALIHLGVAMRLPEGFEAHIVPRSSTFKNWKIIQTNSVGIVDSSYSGKDDWWKMPVYATEKVTIPKGARIAQFRLFKNQPKIEFQETILSDKNRGGFGSTGNF